MFWIVIVILILLVVSVMEVGEKEKTVQKSDNNQDYTQTKSELARSISEGCAVFNAGLKKINDELKLKNQASELLCDFTVKNRTAVIHFKYLAKYVEMTIRYSRNINGTSVKDFIEETEMLFKRIPDSRDSSSSDKTTSNKGKLFMEKNGTGFITPLDDKNVEHYEKPMLGAFNINNEDLKRILLEKTMEIIDDRKSDLQALFPEVSSGQSKALFDGLLENLGEKELFYRLLDS